jgi:transcriptional regulator with PAS, ATPase and Fis domain
MNILMRYDFPGNVRELENVIEHGFVLCRGSIIKREHLPQELIRLEKDIEAVMNLKSTPITESVNEESRIINALKKSDCVLTKAAEELNMHRTTLWRKIKRYNIDLSKI